MAAPYGVVSPLPPLAGLDRFLAKDAAGADAWIHQASERSPDADARLLAAAAQCTKPLLDLVQVIDSGRDATGRAWVATQPLIGSPIAGPMDPAAAVRAIARVAEVLELLGAQGHFPAVSNETVLVRDGNVQVVGFSPLAAPKSQVGALGQLLDAVLAREGRRPDLAGIIADCANNPYPSCGALANALHVLVGGDTRPSNRPEMKTAPSASLPSRAGEVLGSYQLVSRLGEGGMGDVYLAKHTRLGREVALKLLKPAFASDADVVRRFFQEARVVNEINHPHIVEVIDFVEEQPNVFCVMELLKGATLGDLAFASPLPLKRTLWLLQQTCDALHAAHTHGVVHRDVKPANIFVTERNGERDFVKLLDFGVARAAKTAAPHRTQVGMIIGTPAYMSPEQAQGRPVDARADVYAVGAVLFELLSGETLSSAAKPQLPMQTPAGERIPGALADLVMRCVSMEPTARPATALEVGQALGRVLNPPKPESTLGAMAAAGLPVARTKSPPWALIAFVAAVVFGGGGYFAFGRGETPTPEPVVEPPPIAPVPVVEVVDAGPPAPAPVAVAEVTPPPPKKRPPPSKAVKKPDLTKRMNALTRLYGKLIADHGKSALTSLERERFNQSRADFEADDFQALSVTLPEAEQALKVAADRLGR